MSSTSPTSRDDSTFPLVGSGLTRQAGIAIDETIEDGAAVRSGELQIRAIATPGHCPDHTAFLVNEKDCLTADCLFKGTVGGTAGGGPTGFTDQMHSIMQRLLTLPEETRIHPGHREPSTVGDEREHNPFVRVWRGLDPEGKECCRVNGEEARSSSSARITTARTRPGCGTRTVATRS